MLISSIITYFSKNIILFLVWSPLVLFFFLFIQRNSLTKGVIKQVILNFTVFLFFIASILFLFFDKTSVYFQYVSVLNLTSIYNIEFIYGVDGISIIFVLLTTFIVPLCLVTNWKNIKQYEIEYQFLFLVLECFLLNIFTILDLFLFYIFFESILIPMFLLIVVWGSRNRKIKAALYFFIYTLVGSLLMLVAIIDIYIKTGTTSFLSLILWCFDGTVQKYYWLAFFISFAVKIPIMPVHVWLPEAHVEAPTSGSVILAGILLKIGSYGLIRFSLTLFPQASFFFIPLVYTISCLSLVYASFIAIRQVDLKKIIAYASVAHMNLIVLGIFSMNAIGIEGSLFQMISHGITSSGLFLGIGVLYDRYHTRNIFYYGGLAGVMPLFVVSFLIYMFSNIALPGTCNFVGEFLVLLGCFKFNTVAGIVAASGMVFGGIYSLWVLNRVCFGNLNNNYIYNFTDLCNRELIVHSPLVILVFFLGILPSIVIAVTQTSVYAVLYIINF